MLSVFPLLIIGGLAYAELTRLIQDTEKGFNESKRVMLNQFIGANLSTTANRVVQQIDGFMLERISDAITWANAPTVISAVRNASGIHRNRNFLNLSTNEVEALFQNRKSLGLFPEADNYLSRQIVKSPHFGEVFITDTYGFNVALTNPTSDFVQSDENWWQNAVDNGISIGSVEFDSSAGIWSIDISIRIDDPQTGNHLGVMKAVLGISLIQDISTSSAAEIASGDVVVANSERLLLAETATDHSAERIMTAAGNLSGNNKEVIQKALNAASGIGYAIDEKEVVGYAYSGGSDLYEDLVSGFRGFNWLVLVQQPAQVALKPIENINRVQAQLAESQQQMTLIIGAAMLVVSVISIIVSSLLARGITKPILQLQHVAEQIARGETSRSINIISNDEIEDLSKVFNRMRNSIVILFSRIKQLQANRKPE
jgi:HAMP domain-containing protein